MWKQKPDTAEANLYPKSSMNKPIFTPFSSRCGICRALMLENPKTWVNALKYAFVLLFCGPNVLLEESAVLLAFSKWSE